MELKKGEVICDECMGSGNQAKWDRIPDYRVTLKCDKCHGDGKLDWIENITGKKEKIKFDYRINFGMKIKQESSLFSTCAS